MVDAEQQMSVADAQSVKPKYESVGLSAVKISEENEDKQVPKSLQSKQLSAQYSLNQQDRIVPKSQMVDYAKTQKVIHSDKNSVQSLGVGTVKSALTQ